MYLTRGSCEKTKNVKTILAVKCLVFARRAETSFPSFSFI